MCKIGLELVVSHTRRNLCLLVCLCIFAVGCGNPHELEVAPVQGTITYEGKPVTQGFVVFVPQKGKRATSPIDSTGHFSLSTYAENDGAIVGSHKVGIVAFENMEQYYLAQYSDTGNYKMPPEIIPKKFGDPFSSGLTFAVESGSSNQADFALQKPQ